MLPDYLDGPCEISRCDEINKLAYTTVNPTFEDFKIWDYHFSLVFASKSTMIMEKYIEHIKNDMMRVVPAYKDYVYNKVFDFEETAKD